MMPKAARLSSLLALLGGFIPVEAQDAGDMLYKIDERPDPPRLEVDIRLPGPLPVKEVVATVGAEKLPVKFTPFGQGDADTTALLFLIDKSDPKRARAVEAAKSLILQTIGGLENRTSFAVYAFDADLTLVAEIETPKDEVPGRLKAVKAVGMATELYRDTMEAIKVLEKVSAGRKAIILFSDGKAEDTTFTLDQTTALARQAGVALCGVGYAEKPSATIFLQSLRRLAAETGGHFVEADIRTKKTPETFAKDLLAKLRSGGHAIVDLRPLKAGKQVDLEVRVDGHDPYKCSYTLTKLAPPEPKPEPVKIEDNKKVDEVANKVDEVAKKVADMAKNVESVPAKVEEAAKKVGEENRKAEEEVAMAKKQAEEAAAAKKKRFTFAIVGGGLLLLVLLAVAALWLRKKPAPVEGPVYAKLQVLDGDGTELLMRSTALRVGRGADNDLALKNDSVSRHHAEIHRTRDGTFTITELNAGNGVLVNGEPVTRTTLKNDDLIELGEVRIRFLIA